MYWPPDLGVAVSWRVSISNVYTELATVKVNAILQCGAVIVVAATLVEAAPLRRHCTLVDLFGSMPQIFSGRLGAGQLAE